MNSPTCCICFEEWKPYEWDERERAWGNKIKMENFNCGTCNEGKICLKCYEKNSKQGQRFLRSWEYLVREFGEFGWDKEQVKGMECVVCRTPNWKQYYYSAIIKRTLYEEDGLLDKCLWRANRGKRIKPCFWVYLKNEHNDIKQLFPEEKTYYEQIVETYEEYFKDKHEDAFKEILKDIKKLKKYNNKILRVKYINNKRRIKILEKKYKLELWKVKKTLKLVKHLEETRNNVIQRITVLEQQREPVF